MNPNRQSRNTAGFPQSGYAQHSRARGGNLLLLALLLSLAPSALASNTWYVDGMHGNNNNDCMSSQHACRTIGHAISMSSPGDSIMVAAATYRENLNISFNLNLTGAGAKKTIIDGQAALRVISIEDTGAVVVLSKLTIRNGVAAGGGGILNWGTLTLNNSILSKNYAASEYSATGGGIYNSGTLTINHSTLTGNGGSTNFIYGGGIYNSGTVVINNSTFNGNFATGFTGGGGGGIYSEPGTVTINNSTFSGNSGSGYGGGAIYNGSGTVTISNSTLSRNNASGYGGGAIYNSGTTTLQNSIVANSPSGGNCYGNITSNGYNLSSDSTCNFNGGGDFNNVDPKLGPLYNNGGPTQTMSLLAGSPAIDAGNPSGCTDGQGHLLTTDQRGMPRPDREDTSGCDMGAFERQMD